MSEEFEGAVGIDLGTTYSCVATYDGAVEILANEQGNRVTPSFVAFSGSERLVGDAAKNQAALNPRNTIFDAKRLIGRRFADQTVQQDMKAWPFKVIDRAGAPFIEVEFEGKTATYSPQEISAMVLEKMKETAEARLGKKVTKAVVTVPAYFNDSQRQATKDAGAIAGLDVLRIINEPTAAAIAYGLDTQKENQGKRHVLIFDLGGGTFDVSLLEIDGGVFTVKATAGDTHLGGQDFDTNLLEHFQAEFKKKSGKDVSEDPRAMRRLRTAAERAKRTLSSAAQTTAEVDSLADGIDFSINITRARFEALNDALFAKTLEPVEKVMKDSGIAKSKVDAVVLVGGSTRVPKVQRLLSDFFDGKTLEKSINPDEAVAYGAAVQGALLTNQTDKTDLLLLDVVPLSLGVAMEGNIFAPVVPRNTTVPTLKRRTFTTVADMQTSVQFPVYQGERTNCAENTLLGEFDLTGIPAMRAGEPVLEAIFEVDANGILKVTALEKSTGRSSNITISNAVGKLSSADIEKMVEDAQKFKADDDAFSKRHEAKQKLESYVQQIETNLTDPTAGARMRKGGRDRIEAALSDALAALEIKDASEDDLRKAEVNLRRTVSKAFASR